MATKPKWKVVAKGRATAKAATTPKVAAAANWAGMCPAATPATMESEIAAVKAMKAKRASKRAVPRRAPVAASPVAIAAFVGPDVGRDDDRRQLAK